jgi:hypothetical protein
LQEEGKHKRPNLILVARKGKQMKKRVLVAVLPVLILLLAFPSIVMGDSGFTVGPPSINVTVPADGESTAHVYITSGFDGEIDVGTESIPFRVEPETISVSNTDNNRRVELTFYGDESIEEGAYSGKLTFLAHTGDNVAYGVKIKVNVTQVGNNEQVSQVTPPREEENSLSGTIKDNYVAVIIGILVVIALILGIMLIRKRKGET